MDEIPVPYHDMHNRYGEVLTWKPLGSEPRYAQLWQQYAASHKSFDHLYQELMLEYVENFRYVRKCDAQLLI